MTTIKKPEWFFYLAWIILTTLCVPLAVLLYFPIIRVILIFADDIIYVNGVRRITEDYLMGYIFFPTVSLLIGLVQYWMLRRSLPRMGWWVAATVGGWLVGFVLIFAWSSASGYLGPAAEMNSPWAIGQALVVLGLSVGVGQWLLLRRRLRQAGWWIVANVAGWGMLQMITGDSLNVLALGLLPACVTAVTLALLMNQSQPPELSVNVPAEI